TLAGYIASLDTAVGIEQQNDDMQAAAAGLTDAPTQQIWVATESALQDEEKVGQIESVLAAMREAVPEIVDDSDNDYENVISTLQDEWSFPALDVPAVAQNALDIYTTEIWVSPHEDFEPLDVDLPRWSESYEAYVDAGIVDGGGDPDSWITTDYLP